MVEEESAEDPLLTAPVGVVLLPGVPQAVAAVAAEALSLAELAGVVRQLAEPAVTP